MKSASRLMLPLILAALFAAPPVVAQFKHQGNYKLAERDDGGSWHGTWVYVNRDGRWVFWIREDRGKKPEVKLRYRGRGRLEGFETDWSGRSEYTFQQADGTFRFTPLEADKNRIEASWDWDLQIGISRRRETADIEMYRTFRGRMAVVHFRNYEKIVDRRGEVQTHTPEHAWTLRKASNRLVRWEEVLF